MSIGWVSSVPMPIEVTGSAVDGKTRPKSWLRSKVWSSPCMIVALMAGMFSENCSALRTRTGPRSSLSAWVGVKPRPKSVTTSMNIVLAVMVSSSMPMA